MDASDLLQRIERLVPAPPTPVGARTGARHHLALGKGAQLILTVMCGGGIWYEYALDSDETPESVEAYVREHLTAVRILKEDT